MDHREQAEECLATAMANTDYLVHGAWSSTASAHAVLALLDYLQQDDNKEEGVIEPEQAAYIQTLQGSTSMYWDEVLRLRAEVKRLNEDLEGAHAALRAREEAAAAEMKAVKWGTER